MTSRFPEPLPDLPHPFQAQSGCSDDALLRAHDWRIVARPGKGEAIWMSAKGVFVTASRALEEVRAKLESICRGKR